MGDQQAPIGEVFYIEGASSYKWDSGALMCNCLYCILFVIALRDFGGKRFISTVFIIFIYYY